MKTVLLSLLLTSAVTGQVHIKYPADRITTVTQGGQRTFTCNSTAEGIVEWLFNGTVIDATRSDVNDAEQQNNNHSGLVRPRDKRLSADARNKAATSAETENQCSPDRTSVFAASLHRKDRRRIDGRSILAPSDYIEKFGNYTPFTCYSSSKYAFKRVPIGRTVMNYLTISNVQARDAGSYTCRQIYADTVQLIVDTWRELHITEPIDSVIEVDAGDNFTLSCVGYYDSNIVWYWMNQSISWPPDTGSGEQRNIVVTVDTNSDQNWRSSTLSRSLVRSNVAGNYHCRDESGHLAPSRNVTVKVTGHGPHEATAHKATGSGGKSSIFDGLQLWLLVAAVAYSSAVLGRGPFAATS